MTDVIHESLFIFHAEWLNVVLKRRYINEILIFEADIPDYTWILRIHKCGRILGE
jgi:hypothetical protein